MARTFKLTDLQLILLVTASQRDDGSLLPPPEQLTDQGARIRKAIPPLIKHALVEDAAVTDANSSWRQDGDTHVGLLITAAGRAMIAADDAVDIEEPAHTAPLIGGDSPMNPAIVPAGLPARPGSKIAMVADLLRRNGGASLEELVRTTGWLPHTTRAALTGLRKKGHAIERSCRDGATTYTLAS